MSPPGPVSSARDTSALRPGKPEGPFRSAPGPRSWAAWSLALGAGLLLGLASAVAETSTLTGTPEVLDARRMVVAGHEIVLADILAPAPGEACVIRGNPLDCGRLARAGLIDIVAGSEVECAALPGGGHRCFAAGYDLAFGLVHAGWAMPAADAPAHYRTRMRQAQARGRGLWSAQPIWLAALDKAAAQSNGPIPGTVTIDTSYSFQELGDRLDKAVKANDFAVVTRASASAGAAARGLSIPGNLVVGVFRNDYAVRMLEASVPAGIEAPLRFYVRENPDGTATLSYRRPTAVFAPYGVPVLDALAAELDPIWQRIAAQATGQ